MAIKKIISLVLGVFVVASVVYLIVNETKKETVNIVNSSVLEQTTITKLEKVVNGLYFHGANRCYTCNLMEGYIQDVLNESFANEISQGRLTFESINVDESNNKHYIQKYQLQSISFFLSLKKKGKELKFENADKIWHLTRKEAEFKQYIKAEIKKFLEM